MKAIILAAGLGTRLKPLTDTIPKVMVTIGDRPLLEYHLEQLRKHGVKEILINTHYLPNPIEDYLLNYRISHPDIHISTTYEKILLGSAGTILKNVDFIENEEDFLVVYGDNFTNIDYSKLISYHNDHHSLVTIVCNEIENIQEKGMIVFDQNDRIIQFKEKPRADEIISHYSNCGIYMFKTSTISKIKDLIYKKGTIDFGQDIFPLMLQHDIPIIAYKLDEWLIDIGNPANYKLANEKATNIIKLK